MPQERLTTPALHQTQCGASVAGACKISNSTVGEYLYRAEAAGVGWPLGELSEDELYQKLFGEQEPVPEKANPVQ